MLHKTFEKGLRRIVLLICVGLNTGFLLSQSETANEWTDNQFPSYIKRMNHFGERPDWSHDGKKILFISRSFGDVYEMDITSGKITPLTHHYYHGGYLRALYLSNGDILLLGPKSFPSENWQEASGNYPSQKWYWQIWMADIDYSNGKPQIKDQKVILDNTTGKIKGAVLEPQNFRPGNENELTIQSSNDGTEVLKLNLETGALVNLSNSPGSYDEPEGIFPDGLYTLVESSRHSKKGSTGSSIDIYKLKLDTSSTWERITWFNENGKYKATNPVISDDGKYMAFMVARVEEMAGIGHGIYILDFEKYEQAKRGK